MWERIKFLSNKLWVWFYYGLSVYRLWSKVYQLFTEREKNTMALIRFFTISELVAYVGYLKWRADTWRELNDAICSPERVQWLAEYEPHKFIGDCDEFAVYQVAIVNNEIANGNFEFIKEVYKAQLLTVMWYSPELTAGHNVCLLEDQSGKLSYMDYGFPSRKVNTIEEVVQMIMERYANTSVKLCWVVSEVPSLKKVKMSM